MKPGSVKLGILIGRCRTTPSMKSGGGVLLVSALQLIVGLVILFIYEGYKGHYLSHSGSSPPPSAVPTENGNETITIYERGGGLMATTPMDGIFVYSMVINVFALCGLAGMFSQNKHLVLGFFAYNAVNLVVSFHVFGRVHHDWSQEQRHQRQRALRQGSGGVLVLQLLSQLRRVCVRGESRGRDTGEE